MLGEILKKFNPPQSDNLLVGIDGVDDAGVYKISDDLALVQTVDFFPPIVDDPFLFGQVAAANALSDIYAMGGKPVTALNILAIPADFPTDMTAAILNGGADKVGEAGAVIAGGHSIKDKELKYGLAVTGLINPNRIVTNAGAQIGDSIILTKPLGTGIISTAIKQNKADASQIKAVSDLMTVLNKTAGEKMAALEASAATDITGFGLAGHACEMANASGVTIEIDFDKIPLLDGVIEFARAGVLTGGANATREYLKEKIRIDTSLESSDRCASDIIHDPQTSGGLFISLNEGKAQQLIEALNQSSFPAVIIGRVVAKGDFAVCFR